MRSLAAFVFVAALVIAQTPPAPVGEVPLDLAVLAARLDPGTEPLLDAAVPAGVVTRSRERVAKLSASETREVWADDQDPLYGLLCLATLGQLREASGGAAALLHELKVCDWFAAELSRESLEAVFDRADRTPAWRHELGKVAASRRRWLAAKILREHGDSPVVAEVLFRLALRPDATELVGETAQLSRDALRRRGDAADRTDWLNHARVCLTTGALDATARALQAAAEAPPSRRPSQQRRDAEFAYWLRRRLAQAQDAARLAEAGGAGGRLAELRLLLHCDLKSAVMAAPRFAASAEHDALPFAILALAAWRDGRQAEADAHLERALAASGLDADVAGVALMIRLAPLVARVAERGADDREVRDTLAALERDVNRCLAEDRSESAALIRWASGRGMLLPSISALEQALPSAAVLQRQLPDSLEAYRVLLACAMVSDDGELAREVLLRPIPPALSDLGDVALSRAKGLLLLEMRADRPSASTALERTLVELAEVAGCERDAAFLRGVWEWWQAMRPGGDEDHRRAARDAFAGRRWGPSDSVWVPATSARFVTDASLGRAVDWDEWRRVLQLRHPEERVPFYVPYRSQGCLAPSLPVETLRSWRTPDGAQAASVAVLRSAFAAAWARNGDAAAARTNAAAALAAIGERSSFHLPHDRGVLVASQLRWRFAVGTGGTRFDVGMPLDFWIVPRVPGVDELYRLAGEPEPK
ncbi:MAG: hypothetical protein JNL08_06620 [Planctomycetes bacterium]|nr:hypothetical protein [Planctomycetota bacterium]